MARRWILPTLLVSTLLAAGRLAAQEVSPRSEVVDRVVAVVGDSAVFHSDLQEEAFRILAQTGQTSFPEDPAAADRLLRQALDTKVDELLLLQAAARDSITVLDALVQDQVQQQLAQQQQAFGGEAGFQQALQAQGFTLAGYSDEMAQQIRRQIMIRNFMEIRQRERRPPPVSEDRVRAYFDQQKDLLGERPATVTFHQVVVSARATDSARSAARERAEKILEELKGGASFEELARRYTEEPGGRERGGDLGWFRRGQMVAEFETAAYALPPGGISGIVETSFGFHLIKVEKVKGAERQARHILFIPEQSEADVGRTESIAREVAEKMRAGTPVDTLVHDYGSAALQGPGGPLPPRVGPVDKAGLPEPYARALADARPGTVLDPVRLPDQRGGPDNWAVIRVTEVTDRGPYSWDDPVVRNRMRQQLERQLLVEEIVRELRERTIVDIRI